MTRFRIKVVALRDSKTFLKTAEDGSFFSAETGDVFCGYSHKTQKEGKYLDLWLSDPEAKHSDDRRNIITFGRIKTISHYDFMRASGPTIFTKVGAFLIEEIKDETLENSFYPSVTDSCESTSLTKSLWALQ